MVELCWDIRYMANLSRFDERCIILFALTRLDDATRNGAVSAFMITFAMMYSASLGDSRLSLAATSAKEILEYAREILRMAVLITL